MNGVHKALTFVSLFLTGFTHLEYSTKGSWQAEIVPGNLRRLT
jgi:hypothetical protein